jgi:SHS2 domain-containing protein
MYEEIEHTADLAIRVVSSNLPALLEEASRAVTNLSGIVLDDGHTIDESITLKANDPETLLVSWLEELLFRIEVKNQAFYHYSITIENKYQLHADVGTAPIRSIKRFLKAVTFHDLAIEQIEGGLETVIVFDV